MTAARRKRCHPMSEFLAARFRASGSGNSLTTSPRSATMRQVDVLERMSQLRQYQQDGKRAPHKPLLVLLALGNLVSNGSSRVPWSQAEQRLADLINDFGPPSRTARPQSAAYPFTRLRSDDVWVLDHDVPMDAVRPLHEMQVTGRLAENVEAALSDDSALLVAVARALVERQFPPSLAPDVLTAAGLDPEVVLGGADARDLKQRRLRSSRWVAEILEAWDRRCAFCGYDGQLGSALVGIEAAHVRWFNLGGPDEVDNGMALCSLHHKLFDRGVLGLTADHAVKVSTAYSARADAGRLIYDLHGVALDPRPGTNPPAGEHIDWHDRQVFKEQALTS